MSLEHSPIRQQTGACGTASEPPVADDLMVGAETIARFIYGSAGKKEVRDVYRNIGGLPFFKHGNAVAGLKSSIRAALHEAQDIALETLRQKKAGKARVVVRRRSRRAREAAE
jgi:hypothetical protein